MIVKLQTLRRFVTSSIKYPRVSDRHPLLTASILTAPMQLDGIRAIEHRLWRNPEVGACMQPDTYCWKYNLQAVC